MDRIPRHWSQPERTVIMAVCTGKLTIDAHGCVWRAARDGTRHRAENKTGRGYLQVRVMIGGKRYHALAHRLVWQRFMGNIPRGMTINHKNGLKDDNRPGNLELVTPSENTKHAHRTGLRDQHGSKNPAAKLTDNEVAQIRNAYAASGITMAALGDRFGISFQTISKIVHGKRRRKQGGPIATGDLRHLVCDRDPTTGLFITKEAAGRQLDDRTWDEYPDG